MKIAKLLYSYVHVQYFFCTLSIIKSEFPSLPRFFPYEKVGILLPTYENMRNRIKLFHLPFRNNGWNTEIWLWKGTEEQTAAKWKHIIHRIKVRCFQLFRVSQNFLLISALLDNFLTFFPLSTLRRLALFLFLPSFFFYLSVSLLPLHSLMPTVLQSFQSLIHLIRARCYRDTFSQITDLENPLEVTTEYDTRNWI